MYKVIKMCIFLLKLEAFHKKVQVTRTRNKTTGNTGTVASSEPHGVPIILCVNVYSAMLLIAIWKIINLKGCHTIVLL